MSIDKYNLQIRHNHNNFSNFLHPTTQDISTLKGCNMYDIHNVIIF